MIILGNSGGAGHARGDGWLTNGEVGDGGMMLRDSIEVLELLRPVRVWADQLVPDTEGAGRFRGAPSLHVEYGPVDTDLRVMYAADGTETPALGARAGCPGGLVRPFVRRSDGRVETLDAWGDITLKPGETIISISAAGGGYGAPLEREPERVRRDVMDGLVSEKRADEVYGVVLDGGSVDPEATRRRRQSLLGGNAAGPSVSASEDPVLRLIEPGAKLWPTAPTSAPAADAHGEGKTEASNS